MLNDIVVSRPRLGLGSIVLMASFAWIMSHCNADFE